MDGIALIREAEAAGLSLRMDGERLVIRGPKSADAIARRMLAEKSAVVTALVERSRGLSDTADVDTTAIFPGKEPVVSTSAPSGESPDAFAGWTFRPDVDGRMGWEPPDLHEVVRWWARATFDALPEPTHSPQPGIGPCGWCGRRDWWRSVRWSDVVRCGWCHAPASDGPVEWLNRLEVCPAEKRNHEGMVD